MIINCFEGKKQAIIIDLKVLMEDETKTILIIICIDSY